MFSSPGFRIGSVAGIPITVRKSVLVILALLTWSIAQGLLPGVGNLTTSGRVLVGFGTAVLFLASLLAHEVGHALAARRDGVEVHSISLWLFGGVAQLTSEARTPGSAFRIAAAGPAVSIGIGAVGIGSAFALAAVGAPEATVAVLGWLGAVNLVLAVFNLLPGLPLDGGRILQSFLWWRSGDPLAATMKAATGGRVVGFGLMGVGAAELLIGGSYGGLWTALVGSMVGNTAVAERQSASLRRGLRGLPIARVMTPDPTIVASWSTVGDFVRGESMSLGRPAYPLRAWDGRLDGLLVTARLLSAPSQDTMLRDLAVPADQVDIAAPGESIDVVLARLRPYGEGYVVVMDEGRIVGMVGPAELRAGVNALTVGAR